MVKKDKKIETAKASKDNKLTTAEISHFKELLLEKRKEILGAVNDIENEALKKSRMDASGDLSSMPIHMADLGTDNYEQEFSLGLMDGERKILREIDNALAKIDEGTFGVCEATGKQIQRARLEAQPWAKFCVDYARMLEKGQVREEQ